MTQLQRVEVLCVPKRRRLVHSRRTDADGREVLHVFYGEKEIIFDEPELVPFGDKLLEIAHFRAEETMSWSTGAPYEWEKVRELLEALIEQDILKRVAETTTTTAKTYPATLGEGAVRREPKTFSARDGGCEALTQEAFGRAIDLGNLETVVPVYRVGHPALDLDGRQVGENNVTPRPLFLDLPTQRRVCNYAGSRCQADLPMNVTALKHMTARWPELLSLTEQSRVAFFARVRPRGTALSAGDLHLLSVCTLASVGFVMLRGVDPVTNGQLDAGLAAMFRLIDGVRLVTTELVRANSAEHGCDLPVSAQAIADYAEQHAVYYGTHGVCAGPQALIEEYLRVLLGGSPAPIQAEPSLGDRLGDLDAAFDYGLLGQRVETIVRVFGASQALLHERLRALFRGNTPRTKLQELVEAPVDSEHYPLLRDDHPLLDTFQLEIAVNRWLYARSGDGLSRHVAPGGDAIASLLYRDAGALAEHAHKVAEFLGALPEQLRPESLRREVAQVAAEVFSLERRCLRAVESEQGRLNARLYRKPGRALADRDLAVYTRPRSGPPFAVTLGEGLGLTVSTESHRTVLSCGDNSLVLVD